MNAPVLRFSSASMLPSAAAMSAHIAMLALANSLLLNLPTCVLVWADMSATRALSWSHSAISGTPFVPSRDFRPVLACHGSCSAFVQPRKDLGAGPAAGGGR